MNTNKITWIVIGLIVVGVAVFLYLTHPFATPGTANSKNNLDEFASCLKDKGVTFYGAFWCPHCQAQKQLFGSAVKKLPYVECSKPDGQTQTQACVDAKIESYPTWEFADGSRVTGEQSLETLAEKSGCTLPSKN